MLREFVTVNCLDRYGMIVDVAIHEPPRKGDPRNVHAHILLTDRPITPDGFTRTKDRRYQERGLANEFRAAWADCHNRHMERLGLPYRIDHRSLEAQRKDAMQRGDEEQAICTASLVPASGADVWSATARAAQQGCDEAGVEAQTDRRDRVGDVSLRPERGIPWVGNPRERQVL